MKIKKTFAFSFRTSLLITVIALISFYFSVFFVTNTWLPFSMVAMFAVTVFLISFIILQYRIEKFIYQRLKKIYDNVSLLDASDFNKTSVTADIDGLSNEVQKFAESKQKQIVNLTLRENYRREFLGNISHELKTPLFTVQGYLLTLEDGAIYNKKISKKYLKRANLGVERLISIVKDLDFISRLESADLDLKKEPFNIVELVQDAFDLLEIKAKRKNVTLVFDKYYDYPVMVIGDVERIGQVVTNLVENSIKYGKQNGQTVVGISTYNKHKIIVNVIDDGEGIPPEDQARIFERFYRVEKSRSREQGGSGLGLSIAKHIIEAHQEEIFVTSEDQKGSKFSFTLETAENF